MPAPSNVELEVCTLCLVSQIGSCLSNGSVHRDHELPDVLRSVQELPAIRPELERQVKIEYTIAKIRDIVLLPGESNACWHHVTKVTGCQQDHWQLLQKWHCSVHVVGPEVMVASNLRLIAVKAASHKVVGLWIIDSCHRVVLVHVVSEAASLKLIIIVRAIK